MDEADKHEQTKGALRAMVKERDEWKRRALVMRKPQRVAELEERLTAAIATVLRAGFTVVARAPFDAPYVECRSAGPRMATDCAVGTARVSPAARKRSATPEEAAAYLQASESRAREGGDDGATMGEEACPQCGGHDTWCSCNDAPGGDDGER